MGWDGSAFDNNLDSVVWDNPLRFGPDAAGAPSQGRLASWPDNTLTYLHGTGSVALPMRGRLTGYLAVGQATSNADLLPFTINTAHPAAAAGSTHRAGGEPDDGRATSRSRCGRHRSSR